MRFMVYLLEQKLTDFGLDSRKQYWSQARSFAKKNLQKNTHDYIKHLECSLIVSNDISFVRQLAPSASWHPLTSLLLWRPLLALSTPPTTLQLSLYLCIHLVRKAREPPPRTCHHPGAAFTFQGLVLHQTTPSAKCGNRVRTAAKYPGVVWFTPIANPWRSWKLPGISQVLQLFKGKHQNTSCGCCWPQEGQQPLPSSLLRAKPLPPWVSGQPNLTWASRLSAPPLPGEDGDVIPPQGWGHSGNSWKNLYPWRIFLVISQLQVVWL